MIRPFLFLFLIFFTCSFSFIHAARNNDTIHVVPHYRTLMVTDPSRGVNEVLKWGIFPSKEIPVRKITARLTMQCPDGMKCGAWDYLDYVIIRRTGGVSGESNDTEIIRNLTPYGAWFGNEWKFTWEHDLTDWACLLRDSVEIEYQHTGYEGKEVGWLVTVDFEIITGQPVMEPLGFDRLWNQSFAYGDTLRPFEKQVTPTTVMVPSGAEFMNYRVIQTGHGMDRPDNCSEFCTKWRELFCDNRMIQHRDMTIVCGNNPVYPQAGTWVYSRSNWCPGSLATPDVFTIPVTNRQPSFDLKMEPYISFKPSGGWSINAHVFYYKAPKAKNDVTLEQIITPSTKDYYGRMNPVCASPRISIKNNGKNDLKELLIEYGIQGNKKQQYRWTGQLPFMQTQEITLPGTLEPRADSLLFEVKLLRPNGKKDEYEYDNTGRSIVRKVPVYNTSLIVSFRTNNDTDDTYWQLFDSQGKVVYQRSAGDSLKAQTLYNDTLHLQEGCYEWVVTDISNNGLSFWANPRDGYGYIRLLDEAGNILKPFNSDFGTSIHHSFQVKVNPEKIIPVPSSFELTSAHAQQMLGLDIILCQTQDIVIRITDKNQQPILEQKIRNFSSNLLQLDVSFLTPENYWVQLETSDGEKQMKRFRKN